MLDLRRLFCRSFVSKTHTKVIDDCRRYPLCCAGYCGQTKRPKVYFPRWKLTWYVDPGLGQGDPFTLSHQLVCLSAGANLITKYLGEEGLSGSLPKAVAGGVALGNPLVMNSARISLLWSPLMALGAKKCILDNWSALKHVDDATVKRAIRKALMAVTLKQFDEAMAPIFVRNKSFYPFDFCFGFENANDYANDAASYKVVRYIPVPLLTLAAKDDMIVYAPSRGRLSFCLENPNVMWVETMCGGHLGWQEAPPDQGNWGFASSWADSATADFIEATLKTRMRKESQGEKNPLGSFHEAVGNTIHIEGKHGFAEHPRSRL